jgi:hypothetical protein
MRTKFFLGIAFLLFTTLSFAQTSKQKIMRAADLPTFQYSVKGKVEDLLKSEEAFRPFAAEVRKNVEFVLRDYEIEDANTKINLLGILLELDVLENRDNSAREHIAQMKALNDKPSAKALTGLVENAFLDAHKEGVDHKSTAYGQAVSAALKRSLDVLSFEIVQNNLKQMKGSFETLTESIVIGAMRAMYDPMVEKTGGLSGDLAHSLPQARFLLLEVFPLKENFAQIIGAYLISHTTKEKKDIWADRDVILDPGTKYQPVNVAVWDGGVDLSLFKDQVAKDAAGNPAVLAYDIESRKTTGSLYPLTAEQSRRYVAVKNLIKGRMDLRINLDSPEAAELRQTMSKLKPEEANSLMEEMALYTGYLHGTVVASVLVSGNPYARLVTGRFDTEWKRTPDPCPSRELIDRQAAAFQDFVDFFKKNKVRVVNMSWGETVMLAESMMEACGIGKDEEERKRTARAWFSIKKSALEKAMISARDILFVTPVVGTSSDPAFGEQIPADIRAQNLLTISTVDKAGDEILYTSYAPTVVVHVNGEVEGFVPGGYRMKGTAPSGASPNAANAAAKMLAVNPKLSPAQVIEIIRTTADKSVDGRRNLINPKKALAAAVSQ